MLVLPDSLLRRRRLRMKVQNVILYFLFLAVEPVRLRFRQSSPIGPTVMRDSVARDDGSGPIFSLSAVHKNRSRGRIVQDRKRLLDLAIARKPAPFHGEMNVPHA